MDYISHGLLEFARFSGLGTEADPGFSVNLLSHVSLKNKYIDE